MTIQERISNARALFTDELSLRIFDKRIEIGDDVMQCYYSDPLDFVRSKFYTKKELKRLFDELCNPEREIWIYGAGAGCGYLLQKINGKVLQIQGIMGIIDNNVRGARYGLPVITFSEFLEKHKDALVFNSVGMPVGEMLHKQCVDAGVDVLSFFEFDRSWEQYFDLPAELGLVGKDEVFVQAGCYNGDTQKSFVNWFGDAYEKMVTFEPSEEQYKLCQKTLQGFHDIDLVKSGLSDKSGVVHFDLAQPGCSFISDTGSEEIQIVSLDEYMNGGKVTFIALDIEGEEYKALKGAEKIIRTQKPKLAISVYHKPEDIYELPELIHSFQPDYKFYLRHYHILDMAETVLYAL